MGRPVGELNVLRVSGEMGCSSIRGAFLPQEVTMRRSILCLGLLFLTVGLVTAQSAADKETVKARERAAAGVQSHRNVTLLSGTRRATINGRLDGSSPKFDRRIADLPATPDLSCNGVAGDSASNGVPYAMFRLEVSATENLEAVVQAAGTTLADSVLYLYCDPFDDQNPGANLIFSDDDDGGGPNGQLSAFSVSDAIALTPGNQYWLVISTFSPGESGDFQIDLTSATVTAVPVEIQRFSVE